LAEEAIKRSAEARSAEALRKGEARRAEPTCHGVYAEARRAEGRGPKGRGEILGVVNMREQGSELELVPRRVAQRPYGKARPEGPCRRGTVFILRPAGPKVEARRAEAKFWVWLICGDTVAS